MGEEMTYGHLGRSGPLVSRIGLGTMNFGYTVDEPTSFAVMDAAMDAGISSSTTIEELRSDLGALTVQLDAEVVERLDQIWPGPGEAPQAYAW